MNTVVTMKNGVQRTGNVDLEKESKPRFFDQAKNEVFIGRFIPFSSMVSPNDVKTRGGDFFRVWKLAGVSFETNDVEWIANCHNSWCSALTSLNASGIGQFAVWTHRVRRYVEASLSPVTHPAAAADFDRQYTQKLKHKKFLATELYVTLLFRPAKDKMGGFFSSAKKLIRDVAERDREALEILREKGNVVERSLKEFDPTLLGDYTENGTTYSEVEELLGFLVNGVWRKRTRTAGALYRSLPDSRMFFGGDKIELRSMEGTRYAAVIDIKEYPPVIEPGSLDPLMYEDCEFVETQSLALINNKEASAALKTQRDQLIASEDVVQTQIDAMDVALNNVGDGQYAMGEYYYSLVIYGKTLREAAERAAKCAGAMTQSESIQMLPVDVVSDAAFFSQWPGNFQWKPRKATISTRAFAALAAQHNFYAGKKDRNPWGEAAMLLPTPSGQPFFFNVHASDAKKDVENQKIPGNTFILGYTGSGKTTLEMAIHYQMMRFSPQPCLVVFDYDRGSEIALRALGGRYYNFRKGTPTGCSPLQREPTRKRMAFWEKLISRCVYSATMPLTPKDQAAIAHAVETVAGFADHRKRTFSSVRQMLPKDGENSLYHRLSRWCKGGALSWVFDEADDSLLDLKSVDVVGFDYTDFINDAEVRTPIMMYLLDVMSELIDGRRIIYQVSECWKALEDPEFDDFVKNEQKTIRKKNGLGIFETQSPSDVFKGENGRTMVEQSVTKICLYNPNADYDDYVNKFGLTESEYEIVKKLGENGSRAFLVKQGNKSSVVEMDLSGMNEMITVLSGSTDNVVLLDEIREEVGDDPDIWLPILHQRVKERDELQRQQKRVGGLRR